MMHGNNLEPKHIVLLNWQEATVCRRQPTWDVFFFKVTATTEIYTLSDTLSLHDALPISRTFTSAPERRTPMMRRITLTTATTRDRKSTRLNSSHRLTSRMPSSA